MKLATTLLFTLGAAVAVSVVFSSEISNKVRENPEDGLKYVWIPPGKFMMGCSSKDDECLDNEKPQHQVTITRGFWIGQTQVTVGAYKRFSAATGRRMPGSPLINKNWANDVMPIDKVSWDDASSYCGWIGGRLPTEAQWEYAARGGNSGPRYGTLHEIAWEASFHVVAQKRANGFGLFDTLGNGWEWVSDWYDENYYRHSPADDPTGPSSGNSRVIRGGGVGSEDADFRASRRNFSAPHISRHEDDTFRCVADMINH